MIPEGFLLDLAFSSAVLALGNGTSLVLDWIEETVDGPAVPPHTRTYKAVRRFVLLFSAAVALAVCLQLSGGVRYSE